MKTKSSGRLKGRRIHPATQARRHSVGRQQPNQSPPLGTPPLAAALRYLCTGRDEQDLLAASDGGLYLESHHTGQRWPVTRTDARAWLLGNFIPKEFQADFTPPESRFITYEAWQRFENAIGEVCSMHQCLIEYLDRGVGLGGDEVAGLQRLGFYPQNELKAICQEMGRQLKAEHARAEGRAS